MSRQDQRHKHILALVAVHPLFALPTPFDNELCGGVTSRRSEQIRTSVRLTYIYFITLPVIIVLLCAKQDAKMRMAKYVCRFQLLALAMVVLISAPSASANANEIMVNKDKEFDEAYWQEFLSTSFTDPQSPTDSKENKNQRELAYTYGYDYPGEICDHSGFLQVDHVGVEKCIRPGQGLCKDGWEFGIYRKGESYFVQLRKESDRNNPVYKRYEGAKELCIGERPGNIAYMSIKFDHGTQYLVGKDVGSSKKRLPRLKIRPQEGKCRGDNKDGRRMLGKCDNEVIVKYRDGAGDDDCLWEVFFDGRTNTCSGSGWVLVPWPDCQADVS